MDNRKFKSFDYGDVEQLPKYARDLIADAEKARFSAHYYRMRLVALITALRENVCVDAIGYDKYDWIMKEAKKTEALLTADYNRQFKMGVVALKNGVLMAVKEAEEKVAEEKIFGKKKIGKKRNHKEAK